MFYGVSAELTNRMIPLAGILIVFAAVVSGFVMESGPLQELAQPAEIIIIIGSSLGALMVGNRPSQLAKTGRALLGVFRRSVYTRERYLSTLVMLNSVFHFARRHDVRALENAVEDPNSSSLFDLYRAEVGPDVVEFVCDTLRLTSLANITGFAMDDMLENDLETRRVEAAGPAEVLAKLADSLPGFGIVAAVLGVILSMGSMREAPERLGMKIASALIGTFTGILLAYGVVSPLSDRLAKREHAESVYFDSIRAGLSSFTKGMPVAIAIECARRAIPEDVRPDFNLAEERCRQADHAAHAQPALSAKA
jgi:chemotaxis protein MotA